MTGYTEIELILKSSLESEQETVLAFLAAFGFSGFREEEGRIFAYIPGTDFSAIEFESFLDQHALVEKIEKCISKEIPVKNWNEIWERDYSPVQISGNCHIRAPFHLPPEGMDYDLIISPKMSFGTAHHETTRMMLETLLLDNWDKGRVLDFGCGTGILAILAEKMGAIQVIALDNDPLAGENARENLGLNKCSRIEVQIGEIGTLREDPFDTILGNINLNILVQEMRNISKILVVNGLAIFSGFYSGDMQVLDEAASREGLSLITKDTLNDWMVGVYRKAH